MNTMSTWFASKESSDGDPDMAPSSEPSLRAVIAPVAVSAGGAQTPFSETRSLASATRRAGEEASFWGETKTAAGGRVDEDRPSSDAPVSVWSRASLSRRNETHQQPSKRGGDFPTARCVPVRVNQ